MLITTLVVSFWFCCRLEVRGGRHSKLTAPNLQPTTNQERNDQCGNQHYIYIYIRIYHNDAQPNKYQFLRYSQVVKYLIFELCSKTFCYAV